METSGCWKIDDVKVNWRQITAKVFHCTRFENYSRLLLMKTYRPTMKSTFLFDSFVNSTTVSPKLIFFTASLDFLNLHLKIRIKWIRIHWKQNSIEIQVCHFIYIYQCLFFRCNFTLRKSVVYIMIRLGILRTRKNLWIKDV